MVSAIVLAGGYATRLRPLSLTKPKALFPVLDKPMIDYIIDLLENAGISDIYVSLRVMGDKIMDYLEGEGRKIKFVIEKDPLGDAGPLRYIDSQYKLDDTVVVIYGDIYTELNIKDLLLFHEKKDCPATMVGKEVDDPRRYGVLITEGDTLIEIVEKPRNPISKLINAGVYVFDKKLFDLINGSSISKNFLPVILQNNCISVYKYNGIWADIGVPKDYLKLNFSLLAERYPKGYISSNAEISANVTLIPPYFISDGVKISDSSIIDSNTILGKNVNIGRGVFVSESLIMNDVKIADHSYISGSIIADKSNIGKWNHIREGTIIGEEVLTKDGILLNQNTIILPNKEVSEPIFKRGKIIL
jgi:mannose-1-phosphate guanylyltransferase